MSRTQTGTLEVQVGFTGDPVPFAQGGWKVRADLRIENRGTVPAPFSTRNLLLLAEPHAPQRAYLESMASRVEDVGVVLVQPKEVRTYRIYWVIPQGEKPRSRAWPIQVLPAAPDPAP